MIWSAATGGCPATETEVEAWEEQGKELLSNEPMMLATFNQESAQQPSVSRPISLMNPLKSRMDHELRLLEGIIKRL